MSDLWPVHHDDGPLTVRGGVGGIRFQWEELEEAGRALDALAEEVGEVARALGRLQYDVEVLPLGSPHLRPGGGVAGPHHPWALEILDDARRAAVDSSRELVSTGERLRASVWAYRAAEGVADAAMASARLRSGMAVRGAAWAAIHGGALSPGPIELQTRSSGEPVAFDGTVEGVLERIAAVERERPGTIEVLRAGSDEHPVHVLVLPGTQTGTRAETPTGRGEGVGSNPFDVGGIAEALAEDSRYLEPAVREALERSGAAPGDGLIIAGYSQGGLHAVNLAAPDSLGGRYDVQLVLTVGSPTGIQGAGDGEYLHLEHRDDAVPELDVAANPADHHRTTVTLDNPVPEVPRAVDGSRGPWGLGPAHKLANYLEGARLVDASDAPSLAPAAALLAVAGAAGTARRSSFRVAREPGPATAGTQAPAPGRSAR